MKWPWISREAYVDMRAERDRLLALVEQLTRTIVAIKRKDNGLPEREAGPKLEAPVLTPELEHECARWGTSASQQRKVALRLLGEGMSHLEVLQKIRMDDSVATDA